MNLSDITIIIDEICDKILFNSGSTTFTRVTYAFIDWMWIGCVSQLTRKK